MLVWKQAGRTAGFVASHMFAHRVHHLCFRLYIQLEAVCTQTSADGTTYTLYGSRGASWSNYTAVGPRPPQRLLRCQGIASRRHSAGTSTIRSPVFSVPFLPAGLSSRICLINIPLITSPLLRRLPIPRPPTMLIPSDLLGSLQSSTLLWQNKDQNKWKSAVIMTKLHNRDTWICTIA